MIWLRGRSAAGSGFAVAVLLATAGCLGSSKYSRYRSPFSDFQCEVPSGWTTILDSAGKDYYQVTFAGPLDSAFFRGVPSLSIRWYRVNKAHKLPDGSYEMYSSAQDFMGQMLHDIYGPDGYFKSGDDFDQNKEFDRGNAVPDFERIKMSGGEREGVFFVAYHNIPAPKGATLGVVSDDAGHRIVRERHGYAIMPVREGFYVLTYPSTRNGFGKYKESFLRLVKSFRLLREGPQ